MVNTKPINSSSGTCYKLYGNATGRGGPTVVLIHGLGLDQGMWYQQLDALVPHYTVLTYDLTGMGQSTPSTVQPDLSLFARQLIDLLDELEIDKVAVAGFSLGGMIARKFAMDFPQRLWALCVLNSAHQRSSDAHDAIQQRVYQAQNDGPAATVDAALARWFTRPFHDNNPDVMNWIRDTILANDKTIYPQNYQVLVDGVTELVSPDPPITCPTLIMTADEDYGNSPEMSQAIASEISGSVLVVLPGLRHMAMVEAPLVFNEHLLAFINQVSGKLSSD